MRYIRLSDGNYPMSWNNVKADFPNTSFSKASGLPEGYAVVTDTSKPTIDPFIQDFVEVAPVLNGTDYEQTFEIIDFTGQDLTDGLALKKSDSIEQAERAVQDYINTQCVSLGYDNVNSIAKYLTNENDFYAECQSLSLWVGKVWTKTMSIKADVEAGTILEPTPEELVAMLPVYV